MAHVSVPVIENEGAPSITDDEKYNKVCSDSLSAAQNRPRTVLRWATNMGWAILLVIMAVLPSTSRFTAISVPDWFAHATAYGIQAALLYWASFPSLGHGRSLAAGVVGAGAFGVVTEGLQILQPGRTVELRDLAANIVGALLVCCVIACAAGFRQRRKD